MLIHAIRAERVQIFFQSKTNFRCQVISRKQYKTTLFCLHLSTKKLVVIYARRKSTCELPRMNSHVLLRREWTEYTRRKSTWLLVKTISHVLLRRVYTGRHSTCEQLQTTLHVTLRRGLYAVKQRLQDMRI